MLVHPVVLGRSRRLGMCGRPRCRHPERHEAFKGLADLVDAVDREFVIERHALPFRAPPQALLVDLQDVARERHVSRIENPYVTVHVPRRQYPALHRSEEHTSELQSLMRNSYAVFCLKKKNNKTNTTT